MNFTNNELNIFEKLVIENRDSNKLQNITELSYLNSIKLLNKIRKASEVKKWIS